MPSQSGGVLKRLVCHGGRSVEGSGNSLSISFVMKQKPLSATLGRRGNKFCSFVVQEKKKHPEMELEKEKWKSLKHLAADMLGWNF